MWSEAAIAVFFQKQKDWERWSQQFAWQAHALIVFCLEVKNMTTGVGCIA